MSTGKGYKQLKLPRTEQGASLSHGDHLAQWQQASYCITQHTQQVHACLSFELLQEEVTINRNPVM